jgi:hypothetical protein
MIRSITLRGSRTEYKRAESHRRDIRFVAGFALFIQACGHPSQASAAKSMVCQPARATRQ